MSSKNDYHWTFGNHNHLAFPGGNDPVIAPDHPFLSNEGCASISDAAGNLLFYTDGSVLYDSANVVVISSLGGSSSSTQSAIIVPPAGGGSRYHIFATHDWDSSAGVRPLTYTGVSVASGVAVVSGPTSLTGFGPQRSSERLAAVPHRDCSKYWVVSLHLAGTTPSAGIFYAMLIDSDAGPSASNTVSAPYPYNVGAGYYMRFSPDGSLLAIGSNATVDIFDFDRSSGVITPRAQITGCSEPNLVYGIEFSPNGKYLYLTGLRTGALRRYTIGTGSTPLGSTDLIWTWPTPGLGNYHLGALQLAPNGKIYGIKVSQTTLFEIGDPDNPVALSTQLAAQATKAGGGVLTLNNPAILGLPTFTRIASDCIDRCKEISEEVEHQLNEQQSVLVNHMKPCSDQPAQPSCAPLELPPIRPRTSITWGDSKCDCIESDDTEIMYLTVCNPYSNLTLSNLTVHQLVVVDDLGQPVAMLPDGTPAIELVPIGPYCFDDIAPCSCVTRQFVLRLRGARSGRYRILVRGICFDVCLHADDEACFVFDVCKD